MTRVPTLALHQLNLFHTLNTKLRISDLQAQLATGQKSQDDSGIARDSLRLVTLETSRTQAQQFMYSISAADQRLRLMDASLTSIEDLAREFRLSLDSILQGPDAAGRSLTKLAADMRAMVAELLNSSDGDSYLFGGTRSDRRPVDLSAPGYGGISLIQSDGVTVDGAFYQDYFTQVLGNALPYPQGSFYDQIFFDKNGFPPTAPLPPDPNNPTLSELTAEDPDLWQYYVDRLNSAQMLASPKVDYYQGDTQANVVRADSGLELSYDIRADLPAFQQILAAFDAVANLPNGDATDSFERSIIAKARDMLNFALDAPASASFESLDQIRIRAASTLQSLDAVRERHERFANYAEGVIHDIESIDQTEVIFRLQSDQQALEASYAALARLQSLSLLEFI
jgi:flagellin-like hook-associated protein FlgL